MRPEDYWQTRFRHITYGALLGLAFIFLFLIFLAGHFANLSDPTAMDYAQIARRIVTGHGFTTDYLRPYSLMRFPSISEQPETLHPPVHICLIAAVMAVAGTQAKAAAIASGIPFLLTLPLVLALGWRLFGPKVGFLAMALAGTNIACLRLSISGTEIPMGAFLMTALFLLLVYLTAIERLRPPLAAGCGAILALLYLTNYIWLVLALPVLAYLFTTVASSHRWRLIALTIAGFIIVSGPWWYRNWTLTRNPFFTIATARGVMDTRSNPGNTLYRRCDDERLSFPAYAVTRPHEIYDKMVDAAQNLYPSLPGIVGLWVMPFLIAGLLVVLGGRELERLRLVIYAGFLLTAFVLLFIVYGPRPLIAFAPVLIVLAAGYFIRLLDARTQPLTAKGARICQSTVIGALLILHAVPMAMALAPGAGLLPEESAPDRAALELASTIDGPVMTDIPWLVSWVSEKPAIWLPFAITDMDKLQTVIGPVKWLLLTPGVVASMRTERTEVWVDAWSSARNKDTRLGNFAVYKRFSGGDWILYRRIGVPQSSESR